MFNKALSLLLIFSLAFNIAFVGIWVYNRTSRRPPRAGLRAGRAPGPAQAAVPPPPWAQLDLQAPQQNKMSRDWAEVYQKIEALNADGRQLREQLLDLLAAEKLDPEAIRACQQRIDQVQEQVRRLVVEQMLRTRDALTPEQRARWVRMMKAAGQRRGRGQWSGDPRREPLPGPPGPAGGMRQMRRGMRRPTDQSQEPYEPTEGGKSDER